MHSKLIYVIQLAGKKSMNQPLLISFLLIQSTLFLKAQTVFSGKFETGYIHYFFRGITVEPGSDWKGYNLDDRQNVFNNTSVNGIRLANNKLFTGIGLGYLNFEGIHGFVACADLEYIPLKSKLSPLVNVKLGYNHIWNQYQGGTSSFHSEFCLGLNYKLNHSLGIFLKSGILISQQSFLIPITFGFRY
jgi:hypothetical protein